VDKTYGTRSNTGKRKEINTMQWELVIALVIAIPIILFPAAYVWYLNVGGIVAAIKEARAKRIAREKDIKAAIKVKQS
jgi:hypothetical protein